MRAAGRKVQNKKDLGKYDLFVISAKAGGQVFDSTGFRSAPE
jgi:hypothetical protein